MSLADEVAALSRVFVREDIHHGGTLRLADKVRTLEAEHTEMLALLDRAREVIATGPTHIGMCRVPCSHGWCKDGLEWNGEANAVVVAIDARTKGGT